VVRRKIPPIFQEDEANFYVKQSNVGVTNALVFLINNNDRELPGEVIETKVTNPASTLEKLKALQCRER